jgi:hypothetical protein
LLYQDGIMGGINNWDIVEPYVQGAALLASAFLGWLVVSIAVSLIIGPYLKE